MSKLRKNLRDTLRQKNKDKAAEESKTKQNVPSNVVAEIRQAELRKRAETVPNNEDYDPLNFDTANNDKEFEQKSLANTGFLKKIAAKKVEETKNEEKVEEPRSSYTKKPLVIQIENSTTVNPNAKGNIGKMAGMFAGHAKKEEEFRKTEVLQKPAPQKFGLKDVTPEQKSKLMLRMSNARKSFALRMKNNKEDDAFTKGVSDMILNKAKNIEEKYGGNYGNSYKGTVYARTICKTMTRLDSIFQIGAYANFDKQQLAKSMVKNFGINLEA